MSKDPRYRILWSARKKLFYVFDAQINNICTGGYRVEGSARREAAMLEYLRLYGKLAPLEDQEVDPEKEGQRGRLNVKRVLDWH